jgi:hypothetical protein
MKLPQLIEKRLKPPGTSHFDLRNVCLVRLKRFAEGTPHLRCLHWIVLREVYLKLEMLPGIERVWDAIKRYDPSEGDTEHRRQA